jgi:ornithine cyclodeaminase/alanine dehydrogenase-like protein (mu-crystallin family)
MLALVGDALGLKVVSVRPVSNITNITCAIPYIMISMNEWMNGWMVKNNAKLGIPTVPAVILMTEVTTGLPRALLAATYLTALRTAAGSGAVCITSLTSYFSSHFEPSTTRYCDKDTSSYDTAFDTA